MIEKTILNHLLNTEQYTRKVLPFIKPEYYQDRTQRLVFEHVEDYLTRFNNVPTKEALLIEIDNNDRMSEEQFMLCSELISDLSVDEKPDIEWLIEKTEKWCQDKAVYNAIMQSIQIIDGKSPETTNSCLLYTSDAADE